MTVPGPRKAPPTICVVVVVALVVVALVVVVCGRGGDGVEEEEEEASAEQDKGGGELAFVGTFFPSASGCASELALEDTQCSTPPSAMVTCGG